MLRGHDTVLEKFHRALANGRLASTFLFVGPAGIGKRTLALRLAQAFLCERVPEVELAPCGECPSCHQVVSLNHPDVELIAKPADKAFIPLELLIGDAEHRQRAGLCYNIALKPYSGRRKVAIIDDADYLNKEGANCLLKTLEEPPPKSVLILIGTSEQRQLPTIRSRCQIVRFRPLAEADVAALLVERGLCDDPALAQDAAAHSHGSLARAALWCDEGIREFRGELLGKLSASEIDLVRRQPSGSASSSMTRARIRPPSGSASAWSFRSPRSFTGPRCWPSKAAHHYGDSELATSVAAALRWMPPEAPASCLDLCLDVYGHIDANANQATLIEWWLDEVRSASLTSRPTASARATWLPPWLRCSHR